MSLAISNPDLAKFLSINGRASLRCANTACMETELIPRHILAISKAISNPDFAKLLSINGGASLRCANTAFKKTKLIPLDAIQKLYEKNHKTVTATHPTLSENSVSLYNKIADQTCSDIIKITKSEGVALSARAIQCWIYPLIRSIEKEHVARTKHAVISPPDR